MAKKQNPSPDFEKSLASLGELIEKMEGGQLPLEKSLAYFEEGVSLIRQCQKTLTLAEQKIQIVTEKEGKSVLSDFKSES